MEIKASSMRLFKTAQWYETEMFRLCALYPNPFISWYVKELINICMYKQIAQEHRDQENRVYSYLLKF